MKNSRYEIETHKVIDSIKTTSNNYNGRIYLSSEDDNITIITESEILGRIESLSA